MKRLHAWLFGAVEPDVDRILDPPRVQGVVPDRAGTGWAETAARRPALADGRDKLAQMYDVRMRIEQRSQQGGPGPARTEDVRDAADHVGTIAHVEGFGHPPGMIDAIRRAVYSGPGYFVVRGFCSPEQAAGALAFWRAYSGPTVRRYDKRRELFYGCADATEQTAGRIRHFNYFWNPPRDELTHSLAWRMHSLRNRVEGRPEGTDFMPWRPRHRVERDHWTAASYRVVDTQRGGAVAAHTDWNLDHSRVQLSLSLTSAGTDYGQGGLVLDGRATSLTEKVSAGDLVVFAYGRPHGISAVEPTHEAGGYTRLLIPLESVPVVPATPWTEPCQGPGAVRRVVSLARALTQRAGLTRSPPAPPTAKTPYYASSVRPLMELAIEAGVDPAEVFFHRGIWARWSLFDDWQLGALRGVGLKSSHRLLDIGCGPGRAAQRLVGWLEPGGYFGIDPVASYIEAARRLLAGQGRDAADQHLLCDGQFDFARFGTTFDFALAHSVFTHLSHAQIRACFRALRPVMKPGGRLLFTMTFGSAEQERSELYVGGLPITRSRHHDMSVYEGLSRELNLEIEPLVGHDHATQKAFVATFKGAA
jgi:SAM-dependent methyltransferase